jgi:hypothetical protein
MYCKELYMEEISDSLIEGTIVIFAWTEENYCRSQPG